MSFGKFCRLGKAKPCPTPRWLPFPTFVDLLVQIAGQPSLIFLHPVFQVSGHACVERSLGFAGHDVEGGLFYDGAPLWVSSFAGMMQLVLSRGE